MRNALSRKSKSPKKDDKEKVGCLSKVWNALSRKSIKLLYSIRKHFDIKYKQLRGADGIDSNNEYVVSENLNYVFPNEENDDKET